MRFLGTFSAILVLTGHAIVHAQPPAQVRIFEAFTKDAQYHVVCQVEIAGTLTPPPDNKKATPQTLRITGKSSIKYDERIVHVEAGRVNRSVRQYRQLEFERKVGDMDQHSKLRPEAQRLVILRHNQFEVPFCPSGPLLWSELELVRTDVFVPALQGLFPRDPVRAGDRWQADGVAIQELTDLEKIDKAEFTCTLEKIATLAGRRIAQVRFEGKVRGIGEDGNALHELRGSYQFDLDAGFLTHLSVTGTHHLLDKNHSPTGKIEGTFVITRSPSPQTNELSNERLRGLTLEPNAENTLLLFEHPQVGVRFQYPRHWRLAGFNDKQIGVDENRGSGLLITLSPANATPNGAQFFQETSQWIAKQKGKIQRQDKVFTLPGGIDTFAYDVELGKERVILLYYTMRQGNHGATIAARVLTTDAHSIHRDVERIARSIQLSGK